MKKIKIMFANGELVEGFFVGVVDKLGSGMARIIPRDPDGRLHRDDPVCITAGTHHGIVVSQEGLAYSTTEAIETHGNEVALNTWVIFARHPERRGEAITWAAFPTFLEARELYRSKYSTAGLTERERFMRDIPSPVSLPLKRPSLKSAPRPTKPAARLDESSAHALDEAKAAIAAAPKHDESRQPEAATAA